MFELFLNKVTFVNRLLQHLQQLQDSPNWALP